MSTYTVYDPGFDIGSDGLKWPSVYLLDDGYYDLPAGITGTLRIIFGDQAEWGTCQISADGSVELAGTQKDANLVNTDTDGKYCVFDNGTNARIRNRSGGALTVYYLFEHS